MDHFVIGDASVNGLQDSLLSLLSEDDPLLRNQFQTAQNQTLLKPSGGRLADRKAERKAKYQQTIKATNKWGPVVANIAYREQRIFGDANRVECSTADLAASFRPINSFEADLVVALRENNQSSGETGDSKDSHKKIVKANAAIEEAALAAKRAKIRQLLRYEQQKNIRVKKIKSKAYRQIARKNRMLETARLLEVLDEEDPELASSIREKFQEKRASLRMLVKDSARKKWSKLAQRFGGKEGVKAADRELQLAREERNAIEKIAKIKPKLTEEEESDDESGDEYDDKEPDPLLTDDSQDKTGLLNMRFMKEAIKKRRIENSEEAVNEKLSRVEKRVAKLAKNDSYREEPEKKRFREPTAEELNQAAHTLAQGNSLLAELAAKHIADEEVKVQAKTEKEKQKEVLGIIDDEVEIETDYEDDAPYDNFSSDKNTKLNSKNPVNKKTPPASSDKQYISSDKHHVSSDRRSPKSDICTTESVGAPTGFLPNRHHISAIDLNESVTGLLARLQKQERFIENAKTQKDLIRDAFEDEAEEELHRLEEEEAEADAENEIKAAIQSGKLPGWDGAWISERKPIGGKLSADDIKPNVHHKKVFISNKIDKKVNSVLQNELKKRFQYANEEHLLGEQAQPLGAEWNTAAVHKRLIQPSVAIRAGTVIQPLQYRKHMGDSELDTLLDSWTHKRKKLTKTRL